MEIQYPATVGRYRLEAPLGRGAFSVVVRATDLTSGEACACKVVPKVRLQSGNQTAQFHDEICILRDLSHPGILRLFDVESDDVNWYVFMELCADGELFHYIASRRRLPPEEARQIFVSVAQAVAFLHARGIAHRDIKAENMLLCPGGRVKMSDFGFARQADDGRCRTPCGSPYYIAPELLTQAEYDGRKADIWSLGVVLFELMTGGIPWTARTERELMAQVKAGAYRVPAWVPEPARDLIHRMMERNVELRYDIGDVLASEWVSGSAAASASGGCAEMIVSLRKIDDMFMEEDGGLQRMERWERPLSAPLIALEKLKAMIGFTEQVDERGSFGELPPLMNSPTERKGPVHALARRRIIIPETTAKTAKVRSVDPAKSALMPKQALPKRAPIVAQPLRVLRKS
jgi:serine/threonine protein kinase